MSLSHLSLLLAQLRCNPQAVSPNPWKLEANFASSTRIFFRVIAENTNDFELEFRGVLRPPSDSCVGILPLPFPSLGRHLSALFLLTGTFPVPLPEGSPTYRPGKRPRCGVYHRFMAVYVSPPRHPSPPLPPFHCRRYRPAVLPQPSTHYQWVRAFRMVKHFNVMQLKGFGSPLESMVY